VVWGETTCCASSPRIFQQNYDVAGGDLVMRKTLAASYKALKALKMARRSKWLGGNHCFDTASPRFVKLLRAAYLRLRIRKYYISFKEQSQRNFRYPRTSYKTESKRSVKPFLAKNAQTLDLNYLILPRRLCNC
jgi:hypothetical protein